VQRQGTRPDAIAATLGISGESVFRVLKVTVIGRLVQSVDRRTEEEETEQSPQGPSGCYSGAPGELIEVSGAP
jgi:hypothetical protein